MAVFIPQHHHGITSCSTRFRHLAPLLQALYASRPTVHAYLAHVTRPNQKIGFREFVALIAALTALNALAIDAMLPALPQIGTALGVTTDNKRQWVITAYLLGVSSTQVVYGVLADRFGRKRVLLTGVELYAVFAPSAAFATTFTQLVWARAFMGAGAAALQVLAVSIIRDRFAGAQMARVMSLTFMVFLTAPVLAPSIGQAILSVSGWRTIFGFLATFSLVLMTWATLRLPETLHPDDRLPLDVRRVAHAFRTVFGSRMTAGYMLAAACVLGGLFGFITSVQQVFTDIFHAPTLFPLIFAAVAMGMAASSLLNSRIVERLGVRYVSHRALVGFLVFGGVHWLVARGGYESIATFALLQGAMMFCFGMIAANFASIAMEPLGHVAGTGSSIYGSITMAVGSTLGFAIGQQFDGTAVPLYARIRARPARRWAAWPSRNGECCSDGPGRSATAGLKCGAIGAHPSRRHVSKQRL
ncbi:MAG: multidrug effflux MFS transporter [Gemmatimonadaceae bacterium]|nr:multidrug effflux MFS transporter [Gemmatimonadaceae bacterium]